MFDFVRSPICELQGIFLAACTPLSLLCENSIADKVSIGTDSIAEICMVSLWLDS